MITNIKPITMAILDDFRIIADIMKGDTEDCWFWTLKSLKSNTYPKFKKIMVHRLSHITYIGSIPENKPFVLHTCDNKWCWNYNHLYAGTLYDNRQDYLNRGFGSPRSGLSIWPTKIIDG